MDVATVTVTDITPVGGDTVALELETPDGFDAAPGQFVKVSAYVDDEHVSRFYTISSPDVEGTIELTIGVDPDGTLGPWLADALGKAVDIEGPYGQAYYEGESAVFIIAGGPGVGPAVGIGERAKADQHRVTIIYQADEPAHRERLDGLDTTNATVIVTYGSIAESIEELYTGDEQVFIYGFQEFVTTALDALKAAGGDPSNAKVENFG